MNRFHVCFVFCFLKLLSANADTHRVSRVLSERQAGDLHRTATGLVPCELDIRFVQDRVREGKSVADLQLLLARIHQADLEIRRQYRQHLHRDPGAEEISQRVYLMSSDRISAETLTRELIESEEYRRREAARIIQAVYRDMLGRSPSPACLQSQTAFLLRENLNEQALRRQISRSEEFRYRESARIIRAVYRDMLGRSPSPACLQSQTSFLLRENLNEQALRRQISRSEEFRHREAARIVQAVYRDMLGRSPSPACMQSQTAFLLRENLNEQALRRQISRSEEFRHRESARIVQAVYRDMLGRSPSPACLQSQTAFLLRENLNEQALRRQILRSEEYHRRSITGAYRSLLGRNPDSSGMQTYLSRMQRNNWSIAQVKQDIRQSQEYRQRRR